jgi:hypothetical protein
MRKILVLAGLVVAAALVTGTPANAYLSCGCIKLGAPNMTCTATIEQCLTKVGGLCLAPCDYTPPKMSMRKHKKKM